MTTHNQVTPLAVEDYDAIEAAVMETTRGRWFLAEYARRNRNADTDVVLTTLDRIERSIRRERAVPDIDRIRLDLADMAEAISRTKQEIAQMKLETEHGDRFADASHELDAIVSQTETATNEILLAAEGIQEAAWTLREAGAPDDMCNDLDTHSTNIYTACSFQDLTGQRTRKVVTVLRYLESRINTMMSIWGLEDVADVPPVAAAAGADPMDTRPDAHLLNGPQLHGRGIEQSAVDDLMWDNDAEAGQADAEEPPVFEDADHFEAVHAAADDDVFTDADVVTAPSAATPEPDLFAAVEDEAPVAPTPVDIDLAAADVFSSADADRLAAVVRETRESLAEPAPDVFETAPAAPAKARAPRKSAARATPEATATVIVGNTLMNVAVEAAAEAEAAPTLAVVEAEDPIAALSPTQRIVAFG